jgi:hypothetical protein
VLAEGISNTTSLSIGTATLFISVSVLFLWIFINQNLVWEQFLTLLL